MRLGKAFTYKIAKHGKGISSNMIQFVKSKPLLKSGINAGIQGGKNYPYKGIDYLADKAKQKIETIPVIGDGMRRKVNKGKGILPTILGGAGELANIIGGPGSREAATVLKTMGNVGSAMGYGIEKRKATPAQLANLAKGRAKRDANRAKSGGRAIKKNYYKGFALRSAGY